MLPIQRCQVYAATVLMCFTSLSVSSDQGDADRLWHDWEESVKGRYREEKNKDGYRVYDETTPEHVKEFYRLNHINQTLAFVVQKQNEYLPLRRKKMGIWEVIEKVNTLIDTSDPDLNLPQSYHFYQTSEALRRDAHPRWLILTGFLHDLGKILSVYSK